jgi:hypothetical protein
VVGATFQVSNELSQKLSGLTKMSMINWVLKCWLLISVMSFDSSLQFPWFAYTRKKFHLSILCKFLHLNVYVVSLDPEELCLWHLQWFLRDFTGMLGSILFTLQQVCLILDDLLVPFEMIAGLKLMWHLEL